MGQLSCNPGRRPALMVNRQKRGAPGTCRRRACKETAVSTVKPKEIQDEEETIFGGAERLDGAEAEEAAEAIGEIAAHDPTLRRFLTQSLTQKEMRLGRLT